MTDKPATFDSSTSIFSRPEPAGAKPPVPVSENAKFRIDKLQKRLDSDDGLTHEQREQLESTVTSLRAGGTPDMTFADKD